MLTGIAALGQSAVEKNQAPAAFEVAVTYNTMHSNVVPGEYFWMQGGSGQVYGHIWRGLGGVADVTGLHAANVAASGVGLDLVTFTFGPRYTWQPAHRPLSLYGQFLTGEVLGSNSAFPAAGGATSSANSLALQVGGGINVPWTSRITIRAFEADWLRTYLPNSTTNVQNNLRLGAGIVLRFR
jgi:hypothetical protein